MVKGFISFRNGKIPFVIENYRMELFTDDSLLDDFCKEYNFKENYILHGQCFDISSSPILNPLHPLLAMCSPPIYLHTLRVVTFIIMAYSTSFKDVECM